MQARITLAAAAVVLGLGLTTEARADHKGKLPWLNVQNGLAKARNTGKPMMLCFSAAW